MTNSLEERVDEFGSRLSGLPEASEPPQTTLQLVGRSNRERDWQQLLFHYLAPDEPHGLNHELLEHLLGALAERDELDYSFSRFDLRNVQLEKEVVTEQGRPDSVIWAGEDWFICWELKVDASEGDDQLNRYVAVDSFDSIGLDKSDVPDEQHHYIYLAPEEAPPPDADAFVHVSWKWIVESIRAFLAESRGGYPARTTAQLTEFADTIESELTMTDYEENQREKAELYVEHYGDINEAERAFEDRWGRFTEEWANRLAEELDASIVSEPEASEKYVSIKLPRGDDRTDRWTLYQGNDDWAWIVRRGWWRKLDEDQPAVIYETTKPNARVGFLHRLDKHRSDAVANRELKFYLRNAPSGHQAFYDGFAERFNGDEQIPELLPSRTSRPGVKSNVLEATYAIEVETHGDFFDAYVAALATAMDEHVVSNPELVERIDRIYEATIDNDLPF